MENKIYIIDEELEKKEILKRYRNLLKVCRPNIDKADKLLIRRAFNLAVSAHNGVRRKSGEPYVYHPIEVAYIAAKEIGLGGTSIVCALLHDVVEDTDYTISDIKQMFNEKIAKIVDGLTKLSDIFDKNKNISIQAENYKKMLLTLSDDVRVILIKLADRLHNMRTLTALPHEKQLRVSYETTYLFAPLAHRLGLYNIKSEMEDLAFKYIEPEIYNELQSKIESTEKEREKLIQSFISNIKESTDAIGVPYYITHRLKSVKSIWDKMQKKQIPFEEVYDLFAIRIILNSNIKNEKSDCYQVLATLYNKYKPNTERFRDWVAIPKANGYESLHTTLMYKNEESTKAAWIEVQIRTERMNEVAEKGYAAHWKYKHNTEQAIQSGLDEWLERIRDVLHDEKENALELLDDIKTNLNNDEIYVFTPKGALKSLPLGSTVLDFAYSIHSEIGDKCISAKVNNKLVPIFYILKNADQIEIITSSKQNPKSDWLKHVRTSRAKQCIKIALNEEKRKAIEDGKEILLRKLKALDISKDQKTIEKLAQYLKLKSSQELFIGLANATIKMADLKDFANKIKQPFALSNFLKPRVKNTSQIDKKEATESIQESAVLLFGNNLEKMDYTLSTCCNPIPGDKVFGYVSLTQKHIKVHRSNCPNAQNMLSKYAYRVIKAKWVNNKDGQFLSGIIISGFDKIGLVNKVTDIISKQLNVNIHSISFESNQGLFQGTIMLYVKDTSHLLKLINKLEAIDGVNNISRITTSK